MKELKNAEIFGVGTWNGLQFTSADIDSIVNSFVALDLGGHVPLKLTHDDTGSAAERTASQFSLGWVKKLWRDGDMLRADMEVPDKVFDAIHEGYLRFVSVELLKNVQADTRRIPWVLDAVALLGSDQPAVGILKDLTAALNSRKKSFTSGGAVLFKRENHSRYSKMTPEEEKEMRDLRTRVEASEKLAKEEKERRETFERNALKEKADAVKAAVEKKFNDAIEEERIKPNARAAFERSVKTFDDKAWAELNLKEVDDHIETFTVPGFKPKAAKMDRKGGGRAANNDQLEDATDEGKSASETFARRVDQYMLDNKLNRRKTEDYDFAVKEVNRLYPKLAFERKMEPEAQLRNMREAG